MINKNGTAVLPHQNWRGQFSRGTWASGASSDCATSDATGCVNIAWPGWRTTAWHAAVKERDIRNWFGGLVDGMRDASGQMYMRNRYYDPATGQFTQTDPIGLAGGLNSYGFAAGDPVTYGDPFGLRPCHAIRSEIRTRINALARDVRRYVEAHERGEADQQHLRNIRGDQGALRRVRDEYNSEGCNDDDDDDHRNFNGRLRSAEHFITVRLPDPQLALNPRRHPPATNLPSAQTTAAALAGAGGVYLLYRGLRMVPSLLPPLWWTVPANAAVP